MVKRVGETVLNRNGELMELIKYRNYCDIDIEFSDGTVLKHQYYSIFKKGRIIKNKERVGEEVENINGEKVRIIEYRGCQDIDIEFDNGEIQRNKKYSLFKRGRLVSKRSRLDRRVGDKSINSQGYEMEIIAYRGACDIDIQFLDGTIVEHKTYTNFKKGNIRKPKERK